MPKSPKTKKSQPIVDVERPGKSAPSSTSKPVLVTNRPIIQDPMMSTPVATTSPIPETEDTSTESLSSVSHKSKVILPVVSHDDSEAEAGVAIPVSPAKLLNDKTAAALNRVPGVPDPKELAEEAAEEEPASAPKEAPEPDPVPPKTPSTPLPEKKTDIDPPSDDSPSQPDEKSDVDDALNADAAKAEADEKAELAMQKLVDDKTFYLPINAVEKRRTKRVLLLGTVLSIVLALAWVDIALDANLLHIDNVKPLTHFFSN